jgi:hypothetical protein
MPHEGGTTKTLKFQELRADELPRKKSLTEQLHDLYGAKTEKTEPTTRRSKSVLKKDYAALFIEMPETFTFHMYIQAKDMLSKPQKLRCSDDLRKAMALGFLTQITARPGVGSTYKKTQKYYEYVEGKETTDLYSFCDKE